MSIGKNIVAARTARGLTQAQVALRMGVTQGCVTGWETDKRDPRIRQIPQLCSVLGVDVETLLSGVADTSIQDEEG